MKGVFNMNITKKIEKELLFKNNIKEITSISLDSNYKVKEKELVGEFIINGDYKLHEISLNKEKFNFKIPFKEELEYDIESDSIKLEITNFEYDYRKDELLVNIEYVITGDRKDVLIFDDSETLEEFLESREIEVIDVRPETEKIENVIIKEEKELTEEQIIENPKDDRNIENINEEKLLNNINKPKDNFISYKIYKIEENDTLEKIVLNYKTTIEDLKEYNDLNNLQINDKIIIPYYE